MKSLRLLLPLGLLFLLACNGDSGALEDVLRGDISASINPSGRVPLGGLLTFTTKEPVTVSVTVPGETPVTRTFDEASRNHTIPVLGLYPDTDNQVSITLATADGSTYTGVQSLKTAPLPATFPRIDITKLDRQAMEPGFHLIDLLIGNQGKFLPYTVMFDD
ncbi:MAG: aryl-sulfate sulfotransferase N-terminal domain-containing protein, partial [Bacteroidota bacterium]